MASDFVHLHVHSQYSLLEAAVTAESLCKKVKSLGMNSVALTDAGNLFGAYEFHTKALQYGIKPIYGAQVFYLTSGSLESRDLKKPGEFLANLVLLIENVEGYRNLCKLLSIAHLKGFYYKPRIDKETLAKYSQGLIALSGSSHGEIHKRLLNEETDKAKEAAEFLSLTFPERFYLEIQDHGLPMEKRVLPLSVDFAQAHQIPMVATNECRYLESSQYEALSVLQCIQKGWTLHELEERQGSPTDQYHLKSPQEMRKLFKEIPEAVENTLKISQSCHFDYSERTYHFPQFEPPQGLTLEEYLREETSGGV